MKIYTHLSKHANKRSANEAHANNISWRKTIRSPLTLCKNTNAQLSRHMQTTHAQLDKGN
jgi:hypothetical protein